LRRGEEGGSERWGGGESGEGKEGGRRRAEPGAGRCGGERKGVAVRGGGGRRGL